MKNKKNVEDMAAFRAWQESTRALFQAAKEEELALIREEYKDVLAEYKTGSAKLVQIIEDVRTSLDSRSRHIFDSDEGYMHIMEAHPTAMEEIEYIKMQFRIKWSNRYEEYRSVVNALNEEHKRVVAMTKSYKNYQMVMKNLAGRNTENVETAMREIRNGDGRLVCRIDESAGIIEIIIKGCVTQIKHTEGGRFKIVNEKKPA